MGTREEGRLNLGDEGGTGDEEEKEEEEEGGKEGGLEGIRKECI